MSYKVAVVGATGNVGREMLSVLVERAFPASEVVALASSRSVGTEVSFGNGRALRNGNVLLKSTMGAFQSLIADVEDQLGTALLAREDATPPRIDAAPLRFRKSGRTTTNGRSLGPCVLLSAWIHGRPPLLQLWKRGIWAGSGGFSASAIFSLAENSGGRAASATHQLDQPVCQRPLYLDGTGGGAGGAVNDPASCGTCPAGAHSPIPADQTSVSRPICPFAIPSAICGAAKGPCC